MLDARADLFDRGLQRKAPLQGRHFALQGFRNHQALFGGYRFGRGLRDAGLHRRAEPIGAGSIANEANSSAHIDAWSVPRIHRRPFIGQLRNRFTETLRPAGSWHLAVDQRGPNIVRFYYPPAVADRVAYIAPQVTLELGTHAEFIPRGEFSIRSFAAGGFPRLFSQPDVPVTSLLAKRTFWEKATILHAEFHRPAEKATPARYSRHYYDVAMMAAHRVKDDAVSDLDLLAAIVKHKRIFYPSAWTLYHLAKPGTLRLIPAGSRLPELRQDYQAMAAMIFGEPPAFVQIVDSLAALEDEINRQSDD
jgi:hypothetical protein